MTDSGTVQEECCIFNIPVVTTRDVTERPETLECGSNILASVEPESILRSIEMITEEKYKWTVPSEYLENNVSSKVLKIVLGYNEKRS